MSNSDNTSSHKHISGNKIIHADRLEVHGDLNLSESQGASQQHQRPELLLPLPNHYLDRSALITNIVSSLLRPNVTASHKVALQGQGGIGKTTLASAIARAPAIQSRCSDGVLWVSLGQAPQIIPSLALWLQSLQVGEPSIWSPEAASSMLRVALHEKKCLIVIDDVWESEHATPFLVGGTNCKTIITTRRAAVADACGAEVLEVGPLGPEDATALMSLRAQGRVFSYDEQQQLERAASYVGYLPLAIELIGALLARKQSPRQISLQIEQHSNSENYHLPQTKGSSIRRSIDACLDLSIKFLHSDDAQAWAHFLRLSVTSPGSDLSVDFCASVWGISSADAEILLLRLLEDAMLTPGIAGYRVHELMYGAARRWLTAPPPDGLGRTVKSEHQSIVESYKRLFRTKGWDYLKPDGYFHDKLFWHLSMADDVATIENLLSSDNISGSNTWYAVRLANDNLQGFVQDVLLSRDVFFKRAPDYVHMQIRCALIMSSINSAHIGITPALLTELVSSSIWTAAQAVQWAKYSDDDTAIEMQTALLKGVNCVLESTAGDLRLAQRIRDEIIVGLRQELLELTPSQVSAHRWGNFLSVLSAAQLSVELERMLRWCTSVQMKATLLSATFQESSEDNAAVMYDKILNTTDKRELIILLSSIMSGLKAERLSTALRYVLDAFEALYPPDKEDKLDQVKRADQNVEVIDATKPNKELSTSVISRNSGEGTSNENVGYSIDNKDYKSTQVDLEKDVAEAFEASLIFMSVDELTRAIKLLIKRSSSIHFSPLKRARWIEGMVLRTSGSEHEVEGLSNPEFAEEDREDKKILRAMRIGQHRVARAGIKRSSKDFSFYFLQVLRDASEWEKDRLCMEYVADWRKCSQDVRMRLAEAAAPCWCSRIMQRASAGTADILGLVDELNGRDGTRRQEGILFCVSVGWPELGRAVMARSLQIGDYEQQAPTSYSLMPYLPSDFPADLLSPWRDSSAVGTQIATLTDLVGELSRGFSSDQLSEVIYAATRLHSEWWIIEALTLMLRRITERGKIETMYSAAAKVYNTDLRCRIIGRVSARCVLLNFYDLALNGLAILPDGPLKWDEYFELTCRAVEQGKYSVAEKIADQIPSRDTRSRAFCQLALGYAADGFIDEAQSIVKREVVVDSWRKFVDPIIDSYFEHKESVIPKRRSTVDLEASAEYDGQFDGRVSENARKALMEIWPRWQFDDGRHKASVLSDSEVAIKIWAETDLNGDSFSAVLARRQRPTVLRVLKNIAPIVGSNNDGGLALRSMMALRDVVRWWP